MKADFITIQEKNASFDMVEHCTQELQNTKWRFKLITNVTIFAILKNIPMGCPDSVLPESSLKNHSVNFFYRIKINNHTMIILAFFLR